jgi:hypothetical protein
MGIVGPNVNGVSNEVPDGCTVDQVVYVSRHGSRYPDTGAYNQWVALYEKVCRIIHSQRTQRLTHLFHRFRMPLSLPSRVYPFFPPGSQSFPIQRRRSPRNLLLATKNPTISDTPSATAIQPSTLMAPSSSSGLTYIPVSCRQPVCLFVAIWDQTPTPSVKSLL